MSDPATRARRASVTLAGSLVFHAAAAFLIFEIGRATTRETEPPREVEVSVQFAGTDPGQAQEQTVPQLPAAQEPTQPPPPAAEPTPAAPEPQATAPVVPAPPDPPPPPPDAPPSIPDAPSPPPPEPVTPAVPEPPPPPVPTPKPSVAEPPPAPPKAPPALPKPAPALPKPPAPRPRPVTRPQTAARPPGTQPTESQVPSAPAVPAASSPAPAAASSPPSAAPPGPEVMAGWRGSVSAWLQSHKTYPDEARGRGEEGSALVRFTVDRSGRVLEFALVRGTGSASLDAAVGRMLTGAQLPAFPSAMTQDRTTVTVQVRYALQ